MKWIFLGSYLLVFLAGSILSVINLIHQRHCSKELPPILSDRFDEDLLQRSLSYSSAKTLLGISRSLIKTTLLVLFLFGPWLALYDRRTLQATDSFISHGVLFFLGLQLIALLASTPFDLYQTFVIEARYGFNRTTPGLWWADRLKTTVLTLLLSGTLLAGCFWLIQVRPNRWWLWVWLFTIGFSIFVLILSPHFIEPLFHRFRPIDRPDLERAIRDLAEKAGTRAGRIFEVDASRRSHHANAYFTGLGRQKRIVLFDTLLQQLDSGEILAVLAHEMGHWHHRHVTKIFLGSTLISLAGLFLAFQLLGNRIIPDLVGLDQLSFPARVLILSLLASIVVFLFTPLGSWLSRRREWQADRYASILTGKPDQLGHALIKLARNNLANLCPHPLYAWFYYSHPPLVERILNLREDRFVAPKIILPGQKTKSPRT